MVVRVHNVSPLITMPAPPPIGTLSSAAAVLAGKPTQATSEANSTAINAPAKHRCAVSKAELPSSWSDVRAQVRQFK